MVCGLKYHHKPGGFIPIVGLVASYNKTATKYFSCTSPLINDQNSKITLENIKNCISKMLRNAI